MKRQLLTLAAVLLAPLSLLAQDPPDALPEYTEQQRWQRAAWGGDVAMLMALRFAKAQGMTAEEFGRQLGLLYAPSWGEPDGRTPLQFYSGLRLNLMAQPTLELELLEHSDDRVVARSNRYTRAVFGEFDRFGTISIEEYERMFEVSMATIADYLGMTYALRPDGEHLLHTIGHRQPGQPATFAYSPVAPPAGDARPFSGTWEGSYDCRGNPRGVRLELSGQQSGSVEGSVQFHQAPGGPDFPTGSYRVRGTVDGDGVLNVQPAGWIERPGAYVAQPFRARLSAGGRELAGEVVRYSCGDFRARRH
jgi:hypothetical protein